MQQLWFVSKNEKLFNVSFPHYVYVLSMLNGTQCSVVFQDRALNYLSSCIDQVNSFGDILQLVIVELIYKVCHANPQERARFIRCIYNLLNSSSPAVRYEAAGTLVTLSNAPTAVKVGAEKYCLINTLRQRQSGRYFPDEIFKCNFDNENVWISIKISLKFVPKGPINNIPALVQMMDWHHPANKPLSEPVMVSLPTPIWVTLPQWLNELKMQLWFEIMKIPKILFSLLNVGACIATLSGNDWLCCNIALLLWSIRKNLAFISVRKLVWWISSSFIFHSLQAAASCYIELILKEADNNVKLIVLDRLIALKEVPQHERVLQVSGMNEDGVMHSWSVS